MIEIGDVVRLRLHIDDPDTGAPPVVGLEPAVALTITLPDGSTATPLITHIPGSGDWSVAYIATMANQHDVDWVATGFNAGHHHEIFNVETGEPLLVSQDEVLNHLRANGVITSARDLDQIRWLARLATDEVEADLNRYVVRRQVSQTIPAGGSWWLKGPVVSLVSVAFDGVDQDVTAYRVANDKLYPAYGLPSWSPSWWNEQDVTVVYLAGDAVPPTVARQVALRGIQRAWQQSQQMSHPALDDLGAEGNLFTPLGQLTPLEMSAYERLRIRVMA